ncbi:hypothetical protein FE904_14970 [Chryseobacterium indologenes]|uniref:hypothetical protein n=1 Tax=Chryseobacterium indologenes TaxID=253 RepID=UPI001109D678|nr:hypothetical protein [Chryseobacterium indologenes]TLX24672.1 hypothetical protein FE904_14970 [Chryseobacterium indologenes]
MNNKELSQLREIAFEVTIDPKNALHAASAEDVVKVLNAYISSYKAYLEIKLKSENNSEEDIKETIKNTKLLVVNTEFNSYHNSLAPYNPNDTSILPVFQGYKKDILSVDVDDYSEIRKLRNEFTKEELFSIYNPIFSAISNNYRLKVKTEKDLVKEVKKPTKNFATYFKPPKEKQRKQENNDKLFQLFVHSPDLKNISQKDIIYSSELEHETYPYTLDRLDFNDKTIYLNDIITCYVEFVDDLYFISYPDLNIEAWGSSRSEALAAFDFTFYSLVINYVDEIDENLTNDAIDLKNKLKTMIRLIK